MGHTCRPEQSRVIGVPAQSERHQLDTSNPTLSRSSSRRIASEPSGGSIACTNASTSADVNPRATLRSSES